ncbi:MAG TPA: hypothetical protein VFV38_09240 [Ktedonobacteraceae bacterium]|nr:hypothetical protein [Ktedonobacteraceae bacterium]
MRFHDAKDRQLADHRDAHLEAEDARIQPDILRQSQPASLPDIAPSRMYPNISTERIMRAVEQQKRITQQLEDLRTQQQQRTALLRTAGLKFVVGAFCLLGFLASVLVILFIFQPDMLVRTLTLLSDVIALFVAVGEDIKIELSLIPSNSWLLSGAALVVVLMMVMWLRLMRHPRGV